MMLPVVDIVEVGAGGGSIAWVDAAGGLKVGPISAGSDPGPACYGRGGNRPTVTDANLVLGRLAPDNFLGGEMPLDVERARQALRTNIAEPLGMSIEEAALGIVRIVDAKMSLAVREVSVAKGHDPRDFALTATGGAGPLHAVAVARDLAIPKVVIPQLPGTFSAYGMLYADVRHDYVRTSIQALDTADPALLTNAFAAMESEARLTLSEEGVDERDAVAVRTVDLRYRGQEYTLNVSVPGGRLSRAILNGLRGKFDELHYAQYQHASSAQAVEIVNLRLSAIGTMTGAATTESLPSTEEHGDPSSSSRRVLFAGEAQECGVFWRNDLRVGQVVYGPAVIEELVSTTILHPGDRAILHETGAIVIELGAAS